MHSVYRCKDFWIEDDILYIEKGELVGKVPNEAMFIKLCEKLESTKGILYNTMVYPELYKKRYPFSMIVFI